jgi:hypothetical protein
MCECADDFNLHICIFTHLHIKTICISNNLLRIILHKSFPTRVGFFAAAFPGAGADLLKGVTNGYGQTVSSV